MSTRSKLSNRRSRTQHKSQSSSNVGARSSRPSSSSEKLVDAENAFAYNIPDTTARIGTRDVTLRFVYLSDVLLHEHTEHDRFEKLIERIQADRLLKNPPIVAPNENKYIVLDGATRVTALTHLGYRDVVVQVVNYEMPGLAFDTWNHLLIDLAVAEFLDRLGRIDGLKIESTTADTAQNALDRRASIGTIALPDRTTYSLRSTEGDSLEAHVDVLNRVVGAYEGRGEIQRIARADIAGLSNSSLRWNALVIFPRFQPEDIRALALNGHKLPTGITRHIIPGRAMRINIPLELLQSQDSLEKKNAGLAAWMQTKIRTRQVRYYHEPVFLFDE